MTSTEVSTILFNHYVESVKNGFFDSRLSPEQSKARVMRLLAGFDVPIHTKMISEYKLNKMIREYGV